MNAKLAWDDFRLIKAIADHDGLTGAAAALSVNHSTVFRRLGQIEELVGLPLFERRKTGYVATVAGAEMAALASRMDEDVTALPGATSHPPANCGSPRPTRSTRTCCCRSSRPSAKRIR